jgi:hypothetical protein
MLFSMNIREATRPIELANERNAARNLLQSWQLINFMRR